MKRKTRTTLLSAAAAQLAASSAITVAADFTWTQTTTNLAWNNNVSGTQQNNWGTGTGGSFPNARGDTATITQPISANTVTRLAAPITIGALTIGDTDGTNSWTLNNASASGTATPANTLTFYNTGTTNAVLSVPGTGTTGVTISADLVLSSNLVITNPTQSVALTGAITGTGSITKNGAGSFTLGTNNFAGTLNLNGGTLSSGSGGGFNPMTVNINGAVGTSFTALGGRLTVGQGSTVASAPNDRLPSNIVMNGGWLDAGGQSVTAAGVSVTDAVSSLKFNSGYSNMVVTRGGDDSHTVTVNTLSRTLGATTAMVGGGTGTGNTVGDQIKVLVNNITTGNTGSTSFLLGGSSGAINTSSSTQMSIIPWAVGANTNSFAAGPTAFLTYVDISATDRGLRALNSSEVLTVTNTAGMLAADVKSNISTGATLGTNATKTINSWTHTQSGALDIGSGSTLTVSSGGVVFAQGNGSIGGAGSAAAGTLNFGAAEGVVWTIQANTNTIGAVITGSGGLTKAGPGTLVLAGDNNYSGQTTVSGGTLRVGNGTQTSDLGSSSAIRVANNSVLQLSSLSTDSISNTAAITLEQFGAFNGKISLDSGVNETIKNLFFGTDLQLAGTWGSTASSATNKNDTWFSGTGILNVLEGPVTATNTISLSSTVGGGNLATGGVIHITGSGSKYISEVDTLTSDANAGVAAVDNNLGGNTPVFVMIWTKNDALLTVAPTVTGGTLVASNDADYIKLQAAYGLNGIAGNNFEYLFRFSSNPFTAGSPNGAVNWSFAADPTVLVDQIAVVPEPATFGLIGMGTMGLMLVRRRRSR